MRYKEDNLDYVHSPLFYEDGRNYVLIRYHKPEEGESGGGAGTFVHPTMGDYRLARAKYGVAKVKNFEYWMRMRDDALKKGVNLQRHLMVRNAAAALKELSGCVEVVFAVKLNPVSRRGTLFRVDVGYDGWYRDLCIVVCAALTEKLGGRELNLDDVTLTKNGTRLDVLQETCGCDCLKRHSFVEVSFSEFDLGLEMMKSSKGSLDPLPLPPRFVRYSPKATTEFTEFCSCIIETFWNKMNDVLWPHPRSDEVRPLLAEAKAYAVRGNAVVTETIKRCIKECLPKRYPGFEEFCNVHGCHHEDLFERLQLVCFELIAYFIDGYGHRIAEYDEAQAMRKQREEILKSNVALLEEVSTAAAATGSAERSMAATTTTTLLLPIAGPVVGGAANVAEFREEQANVRLLVQAAQRKLETIQSKLDSEGFDRGKAFHQAYEDKNKEIGHALAKSHGEMVQDFRKTERMASILKENRAPLKVGSKVLSDLKTVAGARPRVGAAVAAAAASAASASKKHDARYETSITDKIGIMSAMPGVSRMSDFKQGSAAAAPAATTSALLPKGKVGESILRAGGATGIMNAFGKAAAQPKSEKAERAFIRGKMAFEDSPASHPDADADDLLSYLKRGSAKNQTRPAASTVNANVMSPNSASTAAAAVEFSMPWKRNKDKDKDDKDDKKKKKQRQKEKDKKHKSVNGKYDDDDDDGDGDGDDETVGDTKAREVVIANLIMERIGANHALLPDYPGMTRRDRKNFFVTTLSKIAKHTVSKTGHKVLVYYVPSSTASSPEEAQRMLFHFDKKHPDRLLYTSVNYGELVPADATQKVRFHPSSIQRGSIDYVHGGTPKTMKLKVFLMYNKSLGSDPSVIAKSWEFGIMAPATPSTESSRMLHLLAPD